MKHHDWIWLNTFAARQGGAEIYMLDTLQALRTHYPHLRHHLLYSPAVDVAAERPFLKAFDSHWVVTGREDLALHMQRLKPVRLFTHQLPTGLTVDHIQAAARQHGALHTAFVHDHSLLCLRRHKYTPWQKSTCTRSTGLHCHRCLGGISREQGHWKWQSLSQFRQRQKAYQQVDQLVVGSTYMQQALCAEGFSAPQIQVIPLFYEPATPPQVSAQFSANPHWLFVGRLLKGKGLDILIKALGPLSHRLTVVGEGPELNRLRTLAREHQVSVHWAGWQHDVTPFYEQASALVVPSRTPESFGRVGLEAMARGLPVVASRVGGIPEWLRPGHTGYLFENGDVQALRACLTDYAKHPEKLRQHGQAGFKRWQRDFRARTHVQKLYHSAQSISLGKKEQSA